MVYCCICIQNIATTSGFSTAFIFSSFVSLIALFLIIVSQGKISSLIKSSKKDYLHSALGGFLNPFIYYIFLFKAYALLPAQEAQPLNYTWPIMLILLSIPLLKQKISLKSLLAICISFFGVFVISTHGNILAFHFSNLNGALLALCTAVIWALFWILNIKDKRDELIKLFLNFFFGFVILQWQQQFFQKSPYLIQRLYSELPMLGFSKWNNFRHLGKSS